MNDLSQQATVTLSQTPELSNNDLMANENGETMPFGMLLQFMCHKISQELIVISELLPKYTDYNRKITITEFTYMARCLASKILAIVRWLKNYSKHDMCKRIQSFLDSQSQMFRDTADALCTIARNELVFARVPMYEVSTSVALSYGENIKIPIAIKKRFVPEEKISKAERNNILSIINGNIKSRLSLISSLIPPNIQNIRVKNGIVTLVVPGEFELSLTLLNNDANTKWTLLDIKVLVEQYEIGYGTKLVHPMQLYQIHQYLQQMIVHSKNPINDLYKYMHDFSTSLQLDVLFCESSQLASNQLRNKIIIEKYSQETGELVISYWLILKDKKQYVPSQYKIRICKDKNKPNNKLLVRHYPYIRGAPTLNFNTGRLSMSKLLCEISSMRIVEKLKELKTKLLKIKPLCECIFHDDLHPYISFNLLPSNNMNEDSIMNIYVNTFTGNVTCQMYEDDKNVQVFNDKINRNCNNIDELSVIIRDIKISILMKRYRKIVEKYNLFECSNLVVEEAQSIIHSNHCIVTMLGKKNNESLIFSIKTLDDNNLKINFYICKIANDMCLVRKYNPSNDIMNKRPETIDDILIGMTKNEINKNSINEEKTTDSNLITNFQYLESTFNAFINEYMICKVFSRFCNLPDGNAHFNGKRSTGIGAFTNLFTKNSKAEVYKFGKMALSIVDLWTNDIGPYNIYAVTFDIYNTPVKVDFYKRDRNDNHVVLLNGTNKTFVNFKCYKPWIHPFKIFENISESMRLKRHFNFVIYKAMKNFSHYYYKYFKSFCNIKAYTNGSVTIAYGENRNYLLFLSTCKKNIPYALRFGIDSTKSFVNGDNYKGGEEFIKALNPHMYFIHHLEKYFKNEFFMIFLMKYILKTLNSFLIIFNMPVPRCFLGIYSYEFTSMNNKMEIIAPSKISIYDEFTIRLLLGNSTLEIFVGDEDCIYITDGSCQDKKIPGLHSLILTYSYHKKSFNKPFFDYTNEELESFFEIKNMRYKINYSTLRKLCYDIDGENKYPVLVQYIYSLFLLDHIKTVTLNYGTSKIETPIILYFYNINIFSASISFDTTFISNNDSNTNDIHGTIIRSIIFMNTNSFSLNIKMEFESSYVQSFPFLKTYEIYFNNIITNNFNNLSLFGFYKLLLTPSQIVMDTIGFLFEYEINYKNYPGAVNLTIQWAKNVSRIKKNSKEIISYIESNLEGHFIILPIKFTIRKEDKQFDHDSTLFTFLYYYESNHLEILEHEKFPHVNNLLYTYIKEGRQQNRNPFIYSINMIMANVIPNLNN